MITSPPFIPAEAIETITSPKEPSTLLTSIIPKSVAGKESILISTLFPGFTKPIDLFSISIFAISSVNGRFNLKPSYDSFTITIFNNTTTAHHILGMSNANKTFSFSPLNLPFFSLEISELMSFVNPPTCSS